MMRVVEGHRARSILGGPLLMDETTRELSADQLAEPAADFRISRFSLAVKRVFDVVAASFALMLLAPLMALVAIAIRLDSPGPVIFGHIRIGRGGKAFRMRKFRSMDAGAEARRAELAPLSESNGFFKIADDPRVTRVGRRLRRAYLDELPQLINVLRGEMSLVGPRPLPPDEDALVHGVHRRRSEVPPGITGPWQVEGSWRVSREEMELLDYAYAANRSLLADLGLIARTIPAVISRRGV
jgi:lipopolysaccharide/colanic/teichoic acid biosynthesis glycosyltransferase